MSDILTSLYPVAAILVPVVIGAVKTYTWYRKLVSYDRIAEAKFHEFRKLVDDADNTLLSKPYSQDELRATYNTLWADVKALATKEEEATPSA